MRIPTILLPILLFAFPAFADHVSPHCTPNLTDVDMCAHAVKITADLNTTLPTATGKLMTTTSAAAIGPTVVFRIDMNFDEAALTHNAATKNTTVSAMKENWSTQVAKGIEDIGCSEQMYIAFVYLGGIYKYQYFYSDGALFTEIQQKDCPE